MENQLLLLVLFYGGFLFALAWLSDRYNDRLRQPWLGTLVYALSIGVYCSSWTFLGAVGTGVESGWHYLPIYLAPILLFIFGWRFLRRLLVVSSRNKITSIADFIGSRYGKSQPLAAIVTLILVVGTLPYIALQLRAIGIVWAGVDLASGIDIEFDHTTSLIAALVLAWFAILFGTRVIDGPDRLRGMLSAIAMESLIKLVAFIAVAGLAIWLLLTVDFSAPAATPNFSTDQIFSPLFFTEALLAVAAIICLPRQFHVMVVEYQRRFDLRMTRWLVPLYLGLFAVLVIPLAQVGVAFFSEHSISPDSYVLALPHWLGNTWILNLTVLGSLSAATGMVVVSTIALSIMISNELVVPLWLRLSSTRGHGTANLGRSLRLIRRLSIIVVLVLGWWLERAMSNVEGLASMGLISFAASAQLLPAVLAALYWGQGHSRGVVAGLLVGISVWAYCLLLPVLLTADHSLLVSGPLGVGWLAPQNLFGMGWLDSLSHGVFWSLLLNLLVFVTISQRSKFSSLDLRQAAAFTRLRWRMRRERLNLDPSNIDVSQLQALIEPLLGEERTLALWREYEQKVGHRLLPHDQVPRFAVTDIEQELAAIIGAVSAHKAMELLTGQQPIQLQDFVSLVGGSSRQIQFSQTLLQTTLETVPQGISVVDHNLKLVAWNQQYQKLLGYPPRLLYVGCDIEKIYRYNAERGYLGNAGKDGSIDDSEAAVQRRLDQLRSGMPHRMERELPDGNVIEIRGTPLANGGYVTTYTDITSYHDMLEQLAQAKENLEERVDVRTAELRDANDSLQRENQLRARMEQELKSVHASKSRFLAAASHDLLQPINAARLFVASLSEKVGDQQRGAQDPSLRHAVDNLDSALDQSEQLISSLREISRLGSGKERPKYTNVAIDSLLQPLAQEASALAEKQGLKFRWVSCSEWVFTDPHLLRRVLQNFISNALRHTRTGSVLLGCRRKAGALSIEVWDTGPGIAEQDQEKIFEEFERLPGASGNQGLGLGLSIAQRIAQLLGHPLGLNSELGKGSVFRIKVVLGREQKVQQAVPVVSDPRLQNLSVLCIDNDQSILAGMRSLLEQWGCEVTTAADLGQALSGWTKTESPDLVLADFHLDSETGLDVLEALRYHWQCKLPAVIISADNSEEVSGAVREAGYLFMAKPVQPVALRNLIRRAVNRKKK